VTKGLIREMGIAPTGGLRTRW